MIADANLKPVKMREVRTKQGISIASLFKETGLDTATISRIESGRFVPYDSQLVKIAEALGVDDPASLMEPLEAAV